MHSGLGGGAPSATARWDMLSGGGGGLVVQRVQRNTTLVSNPKTH